VHQFSVAAIRRPVKRRRSVRLRHIDVRMLFDEQTDCGFVPPRGSIRDVAANCSRTRKGHEEEQDEAESSPPQLLELRSGGALRRGGVGQQMIFLTSTTPAAAFTEASPYRARASRASAFPSSAEEGSFFQQKSF